MAFLFPIYIYNVLENIYQLHSQATSQKKLYFSHHGKLPKPYSSAQKVNKLRPREEAC